MFGSGARYELRLSVVGGPRGVSVFISMYFGGVVYSFLRVLGKC